MGGKFASINSKYTQNFPSSFHTQLSFGVLTALDSERETEKILGFADASFDKAYSDQIQEHDHKNLRYVLFLVLDGNPFSGPHELQTKCTL